MNPQFSEIEWNFDAVPNTELLACCYWEYARESAFLLDLKNCWDAADELGDYPKNLLQMINRIEKAPPEVLVYVNAILSQKKFPCPWQKLSQKERDALAKPDFGLPGAFVREASMTEAERLLEEVRTYNQEFRTLTNEVHEKHPGLSERTLRLQGKWPKYQPKSSVFWDEGDESTIVRIAWEHYTNEQIIEAFRCWVKTNRPKHAKIPSKQGYKHISNRVALERLGILRLLHRIPLSDLPEVNAAGWKLYKSENRRWQSDRRKLLAHFQTSFPFLDKNERPSSWIPRNEIK